MEAVVAALPVVVEEVVAVVAGDLDTPNTCTIKTGFQSLLYRRIIKRHSSRANFNPCPQRQRAFLFFLALPGVPEHKLFASRAAATQFDILLRFTALKPGGPFLG
ncbi:MAG TPA: hypothetical protein VIQ51_04450 [Chryseosolibacter sp.]